MCFGTISGPIVLYSTLHSRVQSVHSAGAERKNELGVGWDDEGVLGAAIGDFGVAAVLDAGVPLAAVIGGFGRFLEAAVDKGVFTGDTARGIFEEGFGLLSFVMVGAGVLCTVCPPASTGYTGVIASTPLSLPCSLEQRVSNNFFHASLSASVS